MANRKQHPTCRERNCSERPHLGGYCQRHHNERKLAEELRRAAIETLWRLTVDDKTFTRQDLLDDASRISGWWAQASSAVITQDLAHTVFDDEAEYAAEWCIRLAEQLILAERAARSGAPVEEYQLNAARGWVWERFAYLERGLRSNGTARSKA